MSDLLAARSQMGISLAFHIIFALVGIGMPLLMVVAERRWLITRDEIYLELAQRWAKGTAILFAVGAVSGTVLSFELGLLWPGFMRFGRDHRDAVLARGVRVLHGGDLPGDLPVRLGARPPPRASRGRSARGGERRGVGNLRRHRERVDEYADGVHAGARRGRARGPHRRHAEPRGAVADDSHDARGLRGHGARRRRHP